MCVCACVCVCIYICVYVCVYTASGQKFLISPRFSIRIHVKLLFVEYLLYKDYLSFNEYIYVVAFSDDLSTQ